MTPHNLQALIFDVDGTLADTERAHLAAFNHAFAEEGLGWRWDEPTYTRLLEISGGKERILHYWNQVRAGMLDVSGTAVREIVQRRVGLTVEEVGQQHRADPVRARRRRGADRRRD